jgi:hypothetical protein
MKAKFTQLFCSQFPASVAQWKESANPSGNEGKTARSLVGMMNALRHAKMRQNVPKCAKKTPLAEHQLAQSTIDTGQTPGKSKINTVKL